MRYPLLWSNYSLTQPICSFHITRAQTRPSSHQRLEHCAEIPCGPLPAYFTPGSEPVLGLVVPGPCHSVDLLFYPIPVVTAFRSLVLQVHLPEI